MGETFACIVPQNLLSAKMVEKRFKHRRTSFARRRRARCFALFQIVKAVDGWETPYLWVRM